MTGQGAPSGAPACSYTWASRPKLTCEQPATTRLHLRSGLGEMSSCFCDHHAALVTRKYSGVGPVRLFLTEPLDTAPETYNIQ